jgi:hypothetical protein
MPFEAFGMLPPPSGGEQQEKETLVRLLQECGCSVPCKNGHYRVDFDEGTALSFYSDDFETNEPVGLLIFRFHGFGPLQFEFLYNFARAADFVFVSGSAENWLILTRRSQESQIPQDMRASFKGVVWAASSDELMSLFCEGFDEFLAIRQRGRAHLDN